MGTGQQGATQLERPDDSLKERRGSGHSLTPADGDSYWELCFAHSVYEEAEWTAMRWTTIQYHAKRTVRQLIKNCLQ
jgi:hypothetical protein